MRINFSLTISIVLLVMSFLFVCDRAAPLDISSITSGRIVQINLHSIIIVDDRDQNEAEFGIDSKTVYDGVQDLKDFKIGDKVQIEYQEGHKGNTATTVTRIETET